MQSKKNPLERMPRQKPTLGQKAADWLTKWAGSWAFISLFFIFIAVWIGINIYWLISPVDPYPFILLNLLLSCLAAIQAPVILMSQNRQSERDRHREERDYYIDKKAEREIADVQKDLDEIKVLIKHIHEKSTDGKLEKGVKKIEQHVKEVKDLMR